MYTILMKNDKSLSKTKVQTLYQGENLVDQLSFLIPLQYGDFMLSDFETKLIYIDPCNYMHSETLKLSENDYKGMLQYRLPVDNKLTRYAGNIKIRLVFKNNELILRSGETSITISSTSPFVFNGQEDDSIEEITAEEIEALFENKSVTEEG